MNKELKQCSFCNSVARPSYYNLFSQEDTTGCSNAKCILFRQTFSVYEWQTRPIEDALQARISELEVVIESRR